MALFVLSRLLPVNEKTKVFQSVDEPLTLSNTICHAHCRLYSNKFPGVRLVLGKKRLSNVDGSFFLRTSKVVCVNNCRGNAATIYLFNLKTNFEKEEGIIPGCSLTPPAALLTFANPCVAAGEAIPFLARAVQPDAEDHEDDPGRRSDAGNEGGLLDHVSDLLGEGVLWALGRRHSPRCI